jgi:hypothetical protein
MIVLPEHGDLGAFVGKNGENVKALETVAGASQLVVVRKLGEFGDRWRLKKAIQQLTELRKFALVAPTAENPAWEIVVHPNASKFLVGAGGIRLMFISRLSGLPVMVAERSLFKPV